MAELELIVGDKNLSSWSLRPWLLLAHAEIPFRETVVRFGTPGWADKVRSPNGRVPLLVRGDLRIPESLAICETIAEWYPEKNLWPADAAERARARAVSSEMHAGFAALRSECGMNIVRRTPPRQLSAQAQKDLQRVDALWSEALSRSGGPFLFGRFSVADAMYAPVCTRIVTYSLPASEAARRYIDTIYAQPAMQRWIEDARVEAQHGALEESHGASLSRAQAEQLAQDWAAAWTRRDVEAVLSHFSEDARFHSPRAARVTGNALVRGKAPLRDYWTRALADLHEVRFEVLETLWDADANTLLVRYLAHLDGETVRAAELLKLDSHGKIREGEALYGAAA